jgi:hypothetical protein
MRTEFYLCAVLGPVLSEIAWFQQFTESGQATMAGVILRWLLFGSIHEAYVRRQAFVERESAVWVYRKLLIRTTSLVSLPLATNNCLPSRDQEKAKIRPEVKSVT